MSNDPINVADAYKYPPNWHIVNCTTPAQYFHVLRRQMLRPYRKPLIAITPKSLLKSPMAVSSLEDMAPGTSFKPVLDDPVTMINPEKVEKVVFVSGKLYYDLAKTKAAKELDDRVAIIRIEELSPFPRDDIQREIQKYQQASEFVWCQEEPENAGAYTFMAPRLSQIVPTKEIRYIGREPLSAPATAVASRYRREQQQLIEDAIHM
ncbi:uncharacterized protein BYT42DRAFT_494285 [Radiomyces spectabilis]|uniref:uncharacterized protein n=1 Tax=Radiomyces spectabilis TaxID=64574 RepID=UPI00221EDB94|nr:uncharacterized protein BYT42DRAFT_494285 [Radiomyces spectabilis]KAI8381128.1 hypothetical protein BYT42DRAFT_494285 [Radiomyces spectabilis]